MAAYFQNENEETTRRRERLAGLLEKYLTLAEAKLLRGISAYVLRNWSEIWPRKE